MCEGDRGLEEDNIDLEMEKKEMNPELGWKY